MYRIIMIGDYNNCGFIEHCVMLLVPKSSVDRDKA